jgi:hypothetical protein
MKNIIIITFDADTGEATIEHNDKNFVADGFAIFAGNPKVAYSFAWGYFDSVGNAFKVAASDPRNAALFAEFRHKREITAEEAVEKFSRDTCECVGDGGCVCGNKKIFH